MANILLAVFLLAFGFNLLLPLALPHWLLGILALAAAAALLMERFRLRVDRRGP